MSEMTGPGTARPPVLDQPWRRLPLVMAVSLAFWCVFLIAIGFILELTPSSSNLETLDARIIELPVNGLTGGGGGSPGAGSAAPEPKTAPALSRAKTKPRMAHATRQHQVSSVIDDPLHSHELARREPIAPVMNADNLKVSSKTESASYSTSVRPSGAIAASEGSTGNGSGTGSGNGFGAGSGAGAGGGFGSGGNGPEAIYAPVPSIPDDMRNEVLEAEAVVRFRVSHDGGTTVSLIKPTDFSRLNDIILETLRQWRFRPASRHGVAIDSDAQIRLLITVQ